MLKGYEDVAQKTNVVECALALGDWLQFHMPK
jgi:hypothetical protein